MFPKLKNALTGNRTRGHTLGRYDVTITPSMLSLTQGRVVLCRKKPTAVPSFPETLHDIQAIPGCVSKGGGTGGKEALPIFLSGDQTEFRWTPASFWQLPRRLKAVN